MIIKTRPTNRICHLIFILLIFCNVESLVAQDLSTKNKKAIKYFKKANEVISTRSPDFEMGISYLEKAVQADENFIEAHLILADIYQELRKSDEAIKRYRKVVSIDPAFFPQGIYNLAKLEFSQGEYGEAKKHYELYLNQKGIDTENSVISRKRIKNCDFAIYAIQNPVPFQPENLGDSINSKYHEYWPSLSADENKLVYTILLPKDENNPSTYMNRQEDFYYSERKEDSSWSERKSAGDKINTLDNEGAQTISVDGKFMIFTACNRSDGIGGCDLYVSWFKNEEWTTPVNMGVPINTKRKETQPSISPDGNTIYFASNRAGGKGQLDIWKTTLTEEGFWSEPVNLGDSINTEGDEQSPFIHPDNKTLYFSSDNWLGMGQSDIFLSRKIGDNAWSNPRNLGYPINTHGDEIGLIVNAAGNRAYYSSEREEGRGKDIYAFELHEEARPEFVSYMKGKVYDAITNDPLEAKFEIIDLISTHKANEAYSEAGTGEFLVCIPTDKDYALNVSRSGYLFFSENFSMKGQHDIIKPYIMDVPLQPIQKGEKIILKNIFYETDSYELKPESTAELQKVIEFMIRNPGLVVEISGHTDDVGSDAYNLELSRKRAKSVVDYLVKNNISKSQLVSQGYGETQPIADNATQEGKAQNRRTEMKIIGN